MRGLSVVGTILVLGSWGTPVCAVEDVVVQDGTFSPADWFFQVDECTTSASGSSAVAVPSAGGCGDGGPFLRQTIQMCDPGTLWVFHVNTAFSYAPSQEGAITSIDHSECARLIASRDCDGSDEGCAGCQGTGLVLRQAGLLYRAPSSVVSSSGSAGSRTVSRSSTRRST